jgi:hypothetical protein
VKEPSATQKDWAALYGEASKHIGKLIDKQGQQQPGSTPPKTDSKSKKDKKPGKNH